MARILGLERGRSAAVRPLPGSGRNSPERTQGSHSARKASTASSRPSGRALMPPDAPDRRMPTAAKV